MNAMMGWALAVAALVVGWFSYGWPGLVLAVSVTAFWLLLQFSRALRVMRNASDSPMGRVGSTVMLQSRLKPGLTMMQVVGLTRSLGRKVGDSNDVWQWQDDGDVSLTLTFSSGKLARWQLERPVDATAAEPPTEPAVTPVAPPAAP